MDLDPLLLSRIQFAFVVSFHIIFPAFTIGLAAWLATIEGMRLATGKPVYRRVFDFWLKVFALSFGMGVVSGIVMAFQFGTNWSVLAERTGPIQGPLLGYEGFTAFMLDGLKDGRTGRSPYFWTLLRNPRERIERLNEGLNATARIILLGLVMDAIYQIIVLKRFSPAEAVIVASLFAFVPYVIIRGPVVRIERRWLGAPLQTGSREGTDMNRRQKGIEHDRFAHRRKRGQVRSKGNRG